MDVETAIAYGHALGTLGVRWFEEPVDPLDYHGLAEVAAAVSVPLSTAENLFSTWDVRNLLLFGGLDPATDILQMDPILGYGLAEYKDMLDIASGMGWSMAQVSTHGGHHLSLAATAAFDLGPCEVYPTRFQPFGVVSESSRIDGGMLPLPDLPGLGLEARPDLAALLEQVR